MLPFTKATLDDDFLILMESWKKEEQPHLIPPLKGVDDEKGTTNDDIYVEVLQRLQAEQVRLGASIIYEEAEHIEEDEEYREIYVPAGEVQVWSMIEDEIMLYEGNRIVLPHSAFDIDDLEGGRLRGGGTSPLAPRLVSLARGEGGANDRHGDALLAHQ